MSHTATPLCDRLGIPTDTDRTATPLTDRLATIELPRDQWPLEWLMEDTAPDADCEPA